MILAFLAGLLFGGVALSLIARPGSANNPSQPKQILMRAFSPGMFLWWMARDDDSRISGFRTRLWAIVPTLWIIGAIQEIAFLLSKDHGKAICLIGIEAVFILIVMPMKALGDISMPHRLLAGVFWPITLCLWMRDWNDFALDAYISRNWPVLLSFWAILFIRFPGLPLMGIH